MKSSFKTLILFSYLAVSAQAYAAGDELLLRLDYYLRANKSYTTGSHTVNGSPVRSSAITLRQSGSPYCAIRVSRVQYYSENSGYAREARSLGNSIYEIPDGTISSVVIDFEQVRWDKVNCSLLVYRTGNGGSSEIRQYKVFPKEGEDINLCIQDIEWQLGTQNIRCRLQSYFIHCTSRVGDLLAGIKQVACVEAVTSSRLISRLKGIEIIQ